MTQSGPTTGQFSGSSDMREMDPGHPVWAAWLVLVGVAFVALVLGVILGSASSRTKTIAGPTTTVRVTVAAPAAGDGGGDSASGGSLGSGQFGDGSYIVGQDISAGNYQTAGGPNCYWERLSNLSGGFTGIISNGEPETATTVRVLASDKVFAVKGGCVWTRVS